MSFVSFSAASVVKLDVPQVLLPLPTPLRPCNCSHACPNLGIHTHPYTHLRAKQCLHCLTYLATVDFLKFFLLLGQNHTWFLYKRVADSSSDYMVWGRMESKRVKAAAEDLLSRIVCWERVVTFPVGMKQYYASIFSYYKREFSGPSSLIISPPF